MIKIKLKRVRKYKRMTQEELSEKTGISQSYISAIENNRAGSSPTLDTIETIAMALEVCVKDIIECDCPYKKE